MGTASTKSGNKNKKARAQDQEANTLEPEGLDNFPDRAWLIGAVAILVVATVLRLYDLDLVPLHHDEGVNGNFLVRLVREGAYQYDPHNYHGPTLYYFSAVIPWITKVLFGSAARDNYGLTTFTIRLIPVLFGLGTIGLVFMLRRNLGSIGTLAAGLMLAVSPGTVYLSRYYIHETLFVFFTLGIVVAAIRFYEDRNPSYLISGAASLALLLATKETGIISVGVLLIALAVGLAYVWLYKETGGLISVGVLLIALAVGLFYVWMYWMYKETDLISVGVLLIALAVGLFYVRRYRAMFAQLATRLNKPHKSFGTLVKEMGGTRTLVGCIIISFIVFQVVYLLFYSSFLTHAKGIYDSLETFTTWTATGQTAHVHPANQYVIWLLRQEGTLLFLGTIGAAVVVLRPKPFFAMFSALWAFGLIAAYSLIPYKTPWLLLNFVIPLALVAGYLLQAIYELDRARLRLVSVLLFAAICIATYQSIDLNFINYDNDKPQYVYVYAHSTRGMLDLVNEIERIAKEEGGSPTGITIVSPDYWPLPWYLRNYTRVGYFGRIAASTEPLIIAREDQKPEIDTGFGQVYEQVRSKESDGTFQLRPGVNLLLYHRRK